MNTESVLFALIRVAVCGEPATEELKTACTDEMLETVCTLAVRYDLVHLVGQGISKLRLQETDTVKKCKQYAMHAMYRYMHLQYAYESVCNTLEAGQISFIPLKGSVLRAWYPEPWMRTSCDMDILVHEEEVESACKLLQDKLNYTYDGRSLHDLALTSPEGEHLELHYSTIEENESVQARKIMEGIWTDAKPMQDKQYHLQISDPLFYYYHMAHMAKHFEIGGCGVRSVLDVWVLNHRITFQKEDRDALLEKGGLLIFARGMEKLSRVWFSGEDADMLSKQLQEYIFSGGNYAGMENRVAVEHAKKGGKVKYVFSRLFLPYSIMKQYYPVLQKHKWLLPFCHIARWFKRLLDGGMKRSAKEMQINATVSQEKEQSVANLLKYLELN